MCFWLHCNPSLEWGCSEDRPAQGASLWVYKCWERAIVISIRAVFQISCSNHVCIWKPRMPVLIFHFTFHFSLRAVEVKFIFKMKTFFKANWNQNAIQKWKVKWKIKTGFLGLRGLSMIFETPLVQKSRWLFLSTNTPTETHPARVDLRNIPTLSKGCNEAKNTFEQFNKALRKTSKAIRFKSSVSL